MKIEFNTWEDALVWVKQGGSDFWEYIGQCTCTAGCGFRLVYWCKVSDCGCTDHKIYGKQR